MQKQEAKKQHLLPEFYLNQWADPATLETGKTPAVWVISRDGRRRYRKSPGHGHFWRQYFYDLKSKTGDRDQTVEHIPGKIENAVTKVIRERLPNKDPLTPDEAAALDLFMASMFIRTERKKRTFLGFVTALSQVEKDSAAAFNKPIPDTSLREHNAHPFAVMNTIEILTELVPRMAHAIFIAPDGKSFVTSDDPCAWVAFGPVGLANITIQISLPLSPRFLLHICHSPFQGYVQATSEDVDEMNHRTISRCDKYFVANTQDLILPGPNPGSPFSLQSLEADLSAIGTATLAS